MSGNSLKIAAIVMSLTVFLGGCSSMASAKGIAESNKGTSAPSSNVNEIVSSEEIELSPSSDVVTSMPVSSASSEPELELEPLSEPPQPEPEPEPRMTLTAADIDEALAAAVEDYSAMAISVAAIEDGHLSQSGAWGWASENEREMTADTKMRLASLSKVIVGMCAMAMDEEGIVDIDAPISDYWGDDVYNPYSQKQPSIRSFMTHTSSVMDLETTRGLSNLRNLIGGGAHWRSMEPGDGGYWYYSNFGICVLGTTLELASNQLLDDYFQSHFCEPLGIKASFYSGNFDETELATLYESGSVARSAAEQAQTPLPTAIGDGASYYPGGLTISANDLAKLVAVLINKGTYEDEELLSPESVEEMETAQFSVDPGESAVFDQCLILRRQENILGQDVLYYHTGSAYGVYTLLTFNPETQNGVVVLTTGALRKTDDYGLYSICSSISQDLYSRMDESAN